MRGRSSEIKGNKKNSAVAEAKSFGKGLGRVIDRYDFWVFLLVVLLSLFGVAMVFSAGYYQTINSTDPDPMYYLFRQLFFVLTGFVIMLIVANIDYHIYSKVAFIIMLASLGILLAVNLIGYSANNAQRWIIIAGVRITPSEFCKVAMIVFTSAYVAEDPRRIKSVKGMAFLLAVMAAHFALIVIQPNLSTAIVIVAIMGAIMLVAGMNLTFLVLPAAAAVAGYFYIITEKTPLHWYNRITSFWDPFADRQGEGYQVTQGLIALGNGGLKGLGFGNSIAKNLYLPEPQNDFILAIFGEELGFIGFLVLITVYIILLYKIIMVALDARDSLGLYLASGAAVMLGLQVIINVAVVTSSMPATGITLPFISYGGTSIWAFMIVMGIVLNVSKKRKADLQ